MGRDRIIKRITAFTLLSVLLCLPQFVLAQAIKLDISGNDEVVLDEEYQLVYSIDTPTDLSYLTIIINYDSELFEYISFESSFFEYNYEHSSAGSLQFNAMNVHIVQGIHDIAVLRFHPKLIGTNLFTVLSASAFSAEGEMIGVNTAIEKRITVVSATQPLPTPSEITPSITTESIVDIPSESISESTQQEPEVPNTSDIASTSETDSVGTHIETNVSESDIITSSTEQEETSTIATESSETEETQEIVETNTDEDPEILDSGFNLVIVIVTLLVLVAGVIVIIIIRKK